MKRLDCVRAACAVAVLLFSGSALAATNYVSVAGGNWSTPTTWTPNGVPGAGDTVTITGNHAVVVNSAQVIDSVTLDATSGNHTLQVTGGGSISIQGSGTALAINGSSVAGNNKLDLNGGSITLTSGNVNLAGGIIGTASIDFSAAGSTLTIPGTLSFSGITGNTQISFTGGSGTVVIGGDLGANGAIFATGSTFDFNGTGAQSILGSYTFDNLTIDKIGTATLNAPITIKGGLLINSGVLDDGGNQISLNGSLSSTVQINANGVLKLGSAASGTAFPAPVLSFNVTFAAGSVVDYQAGVTQSIAVLNYARLFVATLGGSVTKTLAGSGVHVTEDLDVNNNGANVVTLNVDYNGLDVDGDINGDGTISLSSGVVNAGGNWSSLSTIVAGATSSIIYDGTGSQSVRAASYANLTISKGSGTATLAGTTSSLENPTSR